jgi:phage terminase small subunit
VPGLLRRCDEAVVAAMAMHLDAAREANRQLSMTSLLESRRTGDAPNPLLRIRRQELEMARSCAASLGFDPASRSRIELPPEGGTTDEWDQFFE